jgi:hypothetical protein
MSEVAVRLPPDLGAGASVVAEALAFGEPEVVVGIAVEVVVVLTEEEPPHAEVPTPTAARPRTTSSLSTRRGYLRGSPGALAPIVRV